MRETFKARAFGHRGDLRGQWVADTVDGAVVAAGSASTGLTIVVRGELTSDGSLWPEHSGRVVAIRENGQWFRY